MKKNILLSLLATIILFILLRWQGTALVTPQSPRGIIDLEFVKTTERLRQLLLFWNTKDVQNNIYLDFIFIAAYVWFLSTATKAIKERYDWTRKGTFFYRLSLLAGMLDVLENLLMLEAVNSGGRETQLHIIYYIAAAKFILAGIVVLYILVSLPIILRKGQRLPN